MSNEEIRRCLLLQLAEFIRNPVVVIVAKPAGVTEEQWKEAFRYYSIDPGAYLCLPPSKIAQ